MGVTPSDPVCARPFPDGRTKPHPPAAFRFLLFIVTGHFGGAAPTHPCARARAMGPCRAGGGQPPALGSPGPDPLSQPGSSGLGRGRVRLRTPSSHTSAAGSTPIIIARIQVIMHGVDLPCPLAQGSPRSRLWAGTGPGPSGPGRAAGGRPATERSLRVRGRCPAPASPPRPHLGSSGIRRSQELRARGPQRPGTAAPAGQGVRGAGRHEPLRALGSQVRRRPAARTAAPVCLSNPPF